MRRSDYVLQWQQQSVTATSQGHLVTREGQEAALTVALSRTLMEHGSATLCLRRACSSSCRGGRSHFPKTTRSMSLGRTKGPGQPLLTALLSLPM